jgi:hypothetical protein
VFAALACAAPLTGCAYATKTTFPPANELFMTTGDGNIQKPYTPLGMLYFTKAGYRLPIPLLGYLPIADVDPDEELRSEIFHRVKEMGGDGVINLKMDWRPAHNGWMLGMNSDGGEVTIIGTVIKR